MQAVLGILGFFLAGLATIMLVPAIADPSHAVPFLETAWLTFFVAGSLYFATRGQSYDIAPRQAYLLTSGAWILLPLFAAIPFTSYGMSLTDAVFESVSGITTTGSTVLSGLDTAPHSLLIWRALLQWVGGIGIIVTSIAILPLLNIGGMQLFRTESSDRSEKELPRATMLAGATLWVYLGLSIACAFSYLAAGMSGFDAVTHAMTTVSSGGYSTHDASLGFFKSDAIDWIATIFMLSGGIPFVFYIRVLRGKSLRSVQVETLLILLTLAILLLTFWLVHKAQFAPFHAFTLVTVSVVSIVTTTGFAASDYTTWGSFAVIIFLALTFMGGCTGSTAGGLKTMRIIVALKTIRLEIHKLIYPHGVFSETYENKKLSPDVMRSVGIFIFIFTGSLIGLTLVLEILGLDFETSLSGAATAICNVGPGIGDIIGPSGNFSSLPDLAKWALSLGMILGRLEFLTLFVMFVPAYWRW